MTPNVTQVVCLRKWVETDFWCNKCADIALNGTLILLPLPQLVYEVSMRMKCRWGTVTE